LGLVFSEAEGIKNKFVESLTISPYLTYGFKEHICEKRFFSSFFALILK
jgi:hypothetical protein